MRKLAILALVAAACNGFEVEEPLATTTEPPVETTTTVETATTEPTTTPPTATTTTVAAATTTAPDERVCAAGQVDINTAGFEELQQIIHIGPDRAQQILDLRPFRSVDDMTRISGIAEARLADIKAQGVACVP